MSTGQLQRPFGPFSSFTRSSGSRPLGLEALLATPVPPFHVLFPTKASFDAHDPLYEAHRAANRIYHDRLAAYEAMATTMSAPDLVAFVRDDVISNLLATARTPIGPFEVPVFRFINPKKLWAWFPPHQRQAEMMVEAFRKQYRRRKRSKGSGQVL
jgi:hypothetical protein